VAIACNPTTPAPRTRNRAGDVAPIAVPIIGTTFASRSAAITTDLYPVIVLIEVNASIFWAREIRGIPSIVKEVTLRSRSIRIIS